MECFLFQRWAELIGVPKIEKLPLGYGYILTWTRDQLGLSQDAFAEFVLTPGERKGPMLSSIKSMESNRKCIPVAFLERTGKKAGYRSKWWEHLPQDVAKVGTYLAETRKGYAPAIKLPSVRLPLAPKDRSAPLRSLFLMDRQQWNRFREYPGWFVLPGFKPYITDDVGGHYPILFADEVFEEDPDIDGDKIAKGDEFAVRTDVTPHPGDMVAATGKKGERYRRILVHQNGQLVLRHFTTKAPDIPVRDVAAIEGVICGRMRRFPDIEGGKASFARRHLSVEHL